MSLGETSVRPTAMLFRNLASDGRRGVDPRQPDRRRRPALRLRQDHARRSSWARRAATCRRSSCPGGPMLNGKFRGADIGSGTDVWRFSEEVKAGTMSLKEFMQAESCMSRSSGTCNVMGTASTMASMAEALGPDAAGQRRDSRRRLAPLRAGAPCRPPHRRAGRAGHPHLADPDARGVRECDPRERRGRRIDQRRAAPAGDRRPRRRAGSRSRTGTISAATCRRIVDLMPSGRFLMEDFYYAGGLPGRHSRARRERPAQPRRDDGQRPHASGRTAEDAPNCNTEVIRPIDKPLAAHGGIAVLRGNLAPSGRGAQAVGRVAAPDAPSRPRGRVREHRALQRADRRSGARRRRRLRARPEGLRAEGLSRGWRRSATWACRRRC